VPVAAGRATARSASPTPASSSTRTATASTPGRTPAARCQRASPLPSNGRFAVADPRFASRRSGASSGSTACAVGRSHRRDHRREVARAGRQAVADPRHGGPAKHSNEFRIVRGTARRRRSPARTAAARPWPTRAPASRSVTAFDEASQQVRALPAHDEPAGKYRHRRQHHRDSGALSPWPIPARTWRAARATTTSPAGTTAWCRGISTATPSRRQRPATTTGTGASRTREAFPTCHPRPKSSSRACRRPWHRQAGGAHRPHGARRHLAPALHDAGAGRAAVAGRPGGQLGAENL
jgi:hypothetical protein